ncbi:MAG: penicillin-binding protein, partial [Alphaproteobacteria bacterium]|nr:penicillin-binding protein [Alphaproteobacteria bacterium]
FRDFMAAALKGKPAIPFRIPSGIELVRINGRTGRLAQAGDRNVIWGAFKAGHLPTGSPTVVNGNGTTYAASNAASGSLIGSGTAPIFTPPPTPGSGIGGLY